MHVSISLDGFFFFFRSGLYANIDSRQNTARSPSLVRSIDFPASGFDVSWSRKTNTRQGVLTVKTFLLCATILALASVSILEAQTTPSAASPGTRVAVIDISKIFKEHPGFRQAMDAMKNEVQGFEQQLQERAKKLQNQDLLRRLQRNRQRGRPVLEGKRCRHCRSL